MKIRGKNVMKGILWIFRIILVAVSIFFIVGECLLPEEGHEPSYCELLVSEWERVLPDGSREKVEVPGAVEAEEGETVAIETILPADMPEQIWLCFRSSQQDMSVYIDGELRKEYSTEQTRPFGNTSMSAFVFLQTGHKDNGKRMRVETKSSSFYTGLLNPIYCGDRLGIMKEFAGEYGMEIILAFCLLIMAVLSIIFTYVLRVFYHRRVLLGHLGMGILLAAVWVIAESRLRQFIFPNISVIGNMAFFTIMLIPFPFIFYINGIQENRYQKYYAVLAMVLLFHFTLCSVLQITGYKDFLKTMPMTHVMLVAAILCVVITIVKDWRNGCWKKYRLVVIGFTGMMLAGIIEIVLVYQRIVSTTGIAMSIGLVILLLMAVLKTGQDVYNMQKENERALYASASKSSFLANMSHEIRTPINSVIGMNEMILRETKDPVIQDYADKIRSASYILLNLVSDVLDFSELEAGRLQLAEAPYQTAEMLSDIVHTLKERACRNDLQVTVQISADIPAVLSGDEIRIRQILTNLISNAVKFTKEGGITFCVQGECAANGKFALKMSVEDTGIGIRREDMDKLFDSFAGMEECRSSYAGGAGLGLNIVRRLLDKMGGDIRVQSVYEKGSVFTVTIPQKIVDESPIGDLQENLIQVHGAGTDKELLRAPEASVLAVDDNAMNLTVVKGLLKNTQVKLELADSGEECLQMCRVKKYDLIFMDHMMPEPDGIETLHILRNEKNGLNASTPVIVLTANAIAGIREEYIREGFTDYLSKPLKAEALEEMLCKYLPQEMIEKRKVDSGQQMQPARGQTVSAKQMINRSMGLSYCAEDEAMYCEILQIYYTQALEYCEKLKECYETKDWKNFSVITHAIKSTSLGIGAAGFSELAKQQEYAGKENNEEFILESRNQFETDYHKLLDEVQEVIAELQP